MTAINSPSKRDFYSLAKLPPLEQYLEVDHTPEQVRRNAEMVVMVVRSGDLTYDPERGVYQLSARPLHQRRFAPNAQLVEDFPYRNASSCYSLGSGFFIQHDLIVTAAHVLFSSRERIPLKDFRFIRGLYTSSDLQSIQATQIFRPVKGLTLAELPHEISTTSTDWATITVRSLASNDDTFELPTFYFDAAPQLSGQRIYGIGYGLGTTLKISNPRSYIITDDRRQPYFECNLPLFVSSSGSPVFNADNHKLIGMLIRATNQLQRIGNEIHPKAPPREQDFGHHFIWPEGQECQRLSPFAARIRKW